MAGGGSTVIGERRSEQIREMLGARPGLSASLREIYEHLLGNSAREVGSSIEYLTNRGELVEEANGRYRLVRKADNRKRVAALNLWRCAHQLSLPGRPLWSSSDLAATADVSLRGAKYWLSEMKARGLILEPKEYRYRIARDAPHRDQPPPFRWPRRGAARSSRDVINKGVKS